MRVVLATIGKFHTFDLARQMERLGALSVVFSGYPRLKLKGERLPHNKIKTFPWIHAPYMRFNPSIGAFRKFWEWHDVVWFDRYVARNIPECDLFCALSGCGSASGRVARCYGARHVCDRGSSHIRFQDQILRDEYDRQGVPFPGIDSRIIEREEAEYEAADAITVPSHFVRDTFLRHGVSADKLHLAPYGVDLTNFQPVTSPPREPFRVLFAGSVCVRKGVHYLLDAFDQLHIPRKHLTLAGGIEANLRTRIAPLLNRPDVSVLGHVSQARLKELMSSSHVMVLPSAEEGLALVQAQALACGCPVIASEHTGGSDLFTDGVEGFIVPVRDVEAITLRLQELADNPDLQQHMREAALRRVKEMGGWDDYGNQMYKVFNSLISPLSTADSLTSALASQTEWQERVIVP
jgi:alpha-maltose-1-phosphate synthase